MNSELAFGWRLIDTGFSAGLDFLGLASPIEGILDAETSGITNATARARYFSLVPWYYWRYTQLDGEGSEVDQRNFAIGFEMLMAYANIAWVEANGTSMSGIIRRDICEKVWNERQQPLPLRGEQVSDTPSPLDAALYGPSLRRLNLLGSYSKLNTCREFGRMIAEEVDKPLRGLKHYAELANMTAIDRDVVCEWAGHLNLESPTAREAELLRALLFSYEDFTHEEIPPRVFAMLLFLDLAKTADEHFTADAIEEALAEGVDLSGSDFAPTSILAASFVRWRILAMLKFLRHAAELAFYAVHSHVKEGGTRYWTAEAAAWALIDRTMKSKTRPLPSTYSELLTEYEEGLSPPGWRAPDESPESVLCHAIHLTAWCHVILRSESGQRLLADEMVHVGQHLDADLFGYCEQLEGLVDATMADGLRWLTVDRAIARHFHVAARKLVQHDTFRLIEDEGGLRATEKCPIANVAIRIDAILSLLADVELLSRSELGYSMLPATVGWFDQRIQAIAGED